MGAKALIVLLSLLLIDIVSATTITGTIYDLELNKADDTIIEIDTLPKQKIVSKDGAYSFEVPNGKYIIKASADELYAEENVSVVKEGEYVIDIILYPRFEEAEILEEAELELGNGYFERNDYGFLVAAAVILALIIYFVFAYIKKKKEETKGEFDDDLKKIIDFIKKEGGRTTQKELRKAFPLSEAKISLMLTELEEKGVVRKIKKGRGNVVVMGR